MPSFTYLYVPTDEAAAVEERTLSFSGPADEIGCLTTALSLFYASLVSPAGAADSSESTRRLLEAEARKKGLDLDMVSKTGALDQLARTQMVDVVPLLLGTKASDWVGVSLYCDDAAVAKGYGLNVRATKLCVASGRPVRILGDVFVARAQDDNNDLYNRLDLTVGEFAPQAPWVVAALQANAGGKMVGAIAEGDMSSPGGGEGKAAAAAAPPAPPSAARLAAYTEELGAWVVGKLAGFDGDEKVAASKG